MSRWKGLSKPQLLQWDRLLDDLQGSFYWMIIDIVLYGREVSRQKFRFFGGCQTVYQWSNRKNDKRQRVLFFAPLPIGITFMTILLLEIISCGKGLIDLGTSILAYRVKCSQDARIYPYFQSFLKILNLFMVALSHGAYSTQLRRLYSVSINSQVSVASHFKNITPQLLSGIYDLKNISSAPSALNRASTNYCFAHKITTHFIYIYMRVHGCEHAHQSYLFVKGKHRGYAAAALNSSEAAIITLASI